MAMGASLETLTQWGSLEPAFYLTFLGILRTWQVWGTLNLSTGNDNTRRRISCACLIHLLVCPLNRWQHPHFRKKEMGAS